MISKILIFLYAMIIHRVIGATEDYCSSNLCQGSMHIACNNTIDDPWASRCIRPEILEMDLRKIEMILDVHNQLRSLFAMGDLEKFRPARRMPTLQWNNELAQLAEMNVKQCDIKHDECRSTDEFPFAGQNLAITFFSEKINDVEIVRMIIGWFNEYLNATQEVLDRYGANPNDSELGHFTLMVNDRVTHIGCAVSKLLDNRYNITLNSMLLCCNYSFTNIILFPSYTPGIPCSGCSTGCNPSYQGLCNINERVLSTIIN